MGHGTTHTIAALEVELKRVAHQLHDEAGSLLTSAYLSLDQMAVHAAPSDQRAIQDVRSVLDQVETLLRRMSHELRPTILDDFGLAAGLEFLAEGFSQRHHIEIRVHCTEGKRFPPRIETAIYRLVQEALNNIVKHAHAQCVEIQVWREAAKIHCCVKDDGVGIDALAASALKGRGGLGLLGMRERVKALHGTCAVRSLPGHGTEVVATVPVGGRFAGIKPRAASHAASRLHHRARRLHGAAASSPSR